MSRSRKSHSTLIIIILFVSAIMIIFIAILIMERKRNKMKEVKLNPTDDGIFRDDPDGAYHHSTEDRTETNSLEDLNGDCNDNNDNNDNNNNNGNGIFVEELDTNNEELIRIS